jgi:pyruvate formate lyase activating enzyme
MKQMYPREAKLYHKMTGKSVTCNLCEHHCLIDNGEVGFCRARKNQDGILNTLVYGYAVMHKQTQVERHNLYHYIPGTKTYSIGTPGCNFRCWWCNEWKVARMPSPGIFTAVEEISPAGIISAAKTNGCQSITFAYTEPTVFFEYAYDISRMAKRTGLRTIMATNGFMTNEMLDAFLPYLNAAVVDLKTFRLKTYFSDKKIHLQVLLDNAKRMKQAGVWLEINTLHIAGVNEDPGQLRELAETIAADLGPETPWHINRLFPAWDLTKRPPEELEGLRAAKDIGHEAGLKHVYIERVTGEYNTWCGECGELAIERRGTQVISYLTHDSKCKNCRTPLSGVFTGDKTRKELVEYKEGPLAIKKI